MFLLSLRNKISYIHSYFRTINHASDQNATTQLKYETPLFPPHQFNVSLHIYSFASKTIIYIDVGLCEDDTHYV